MTQAQLQPQEQNQALCRFEQIKKEMTVGDVFEMHCEWPPHLAVLSEPIRIEFPNQALSPKDQEQYGDLKKKLPTESAPHNQTETKPSPYSLAILQTKAIFPGKATFKVTSYQPGHYHTGFTLISDRGTVKVQALSWQVKSVLKAGQQAKPYPPYGPWMEPLPFWYWPLGALTLLGILLFLFMQIRVGVKRKKKIKEVQSRLKNKQAYQEFISQLNQLTWKIYPHKMDNSKTTPTIIADKSKQETTKNTRSIVAEIEQAFRLFLENQFFIYALKETPKTIIQQLKKYYPLIYQNHKSPILNLFAELKRLSVIKSNIEDLEPTINMARKTATQLLTSRPHLAKNYNQR